MAVDGRVALPLGGAARASDSEASLVFSVEPRRQ